MYGTWIRKADRQKEKNPKRETSIMEMYNEAVIRMNANHFISQMTVQSSSCLILCANQAARFYLSFDIKPALVQTTGKPLLLSSTSLTSNENWHSIWMMSKVSHFGSHQPPRLRNQEY